MQIMLKLKLHLLLGLDITIVEKGIIWDFLLNYQLLSGFTLRPDLPKTVKLSRIIQGPR